jgi:hypothetical protein
MKHAPIQQPATAGLFPDDGQGHGELHAMGGKCALMMNVDAIQTHSIADNPSPRSPNLVTPEHRQAVLPTEPPLPTALPQTQNA